MPTSEDLLDYRARVAATISRLGQQAHRMETFVAEPEEPLAVCRRKAASADALVVCVAHRYGWVPNAEEQGDGKKSVTWHEVEAARKAGKPVFEAFKSFLDREVTRATFTTPEDLAEKVATSLFPWLLGQALSRAGESRSEEAQPAPPVDLTSYLGELIDRTDHINISGIATQHARGALRHPIERLYTPLSSRGTWLGDGEAEGMLRGMRHERVDLADLLPRFPRLLIEGQPGAGKTTFLRFAACMLARDVLGRPCPDGKSWCDRHLGLGEEAAPKIPVLLRVADLVTLLTAADGPKLRGDNRQWLLDLLERSCEEDRHTVPREHWDRLLRDGDAVLLLDGLDEAADETLRQRIFSIVRDVDKKWRCAMVVTSRPIETAPLREMGFHPAVIEPFGEREIRAFVDHWVAALHAVEQARRGVAARRGATAIC